MSALAEAWIVYNADGSARRDLRRGVVGTLPRGPCEWARCLCRCDSSCGCPRTHERAHIEQGPNEELAYIAQLVTLERLRAHDIDLARCDEPAEVVKRQQRGAQLTAGAG